MSTFKYGKHTNKHIGIYLRRDNNINTEIKKSKNRRLFENIERIVISDYEKCSNSVWIEVWCYNSLYNLFSNRNRYNVFYLFLPVDENWSCDGDNGGGINFFDNID